MKKHSEITQKDFEGLLNWLAPDREEAGKKYEEIRDGLIRFFRFKGCNDPEFLADETINRVASKILTFNLDPMAKTISCFYGFASKIYLEYVRQRAKRETQIEPNISLIDKTPFPSVETKDEEFDCLESCLAKLPSDESQLIILYYSQEKSAKLELRKKIAKNQS